MAKEAAEAFVKRYASDEAFRNKVGGLDSPQAIRTVLDQEGFGQFTRQELEDARKAATASGELSDAELDAVAGGSWGVEYTYDGGCSNGHTDEGGNVTCPSAYYHICTSVW